MMTAMSDPEVLRHRLCGLQEHVLRAVLESRAEAGRELTGVVGRTVADVSYGLDGVADAVVLPWFEREWPATEPVLVVSEGLDEPVLVGAGEPQWTCIVDTVDGTPRPDVRQARGVEPGGTRPGRGHPRPRCRRRDDRAADDQAVGE